MGATNITLASALTAAGGGQTRQGTAGAAITAGQAVYFDSSTQTYKLAQGDTATKAAAVGIALNTAGSGQPVIVHTKGVLQALTGLGQGKLYVISDDSAGALMEAGDLGTGDYPTFVGIAKSTTTMDVEILAPGIAKS